MRTELQPTHLFGSLVRLCPLRESDFEELFAVAEDPMIWEQHPEPTRYQREVFEKFFRGAMDSRGAFLIRDAKAGEAIGSSRYLNYLPEKREVEVGFTFLARRCWGHTYNLELKQLMLKHAFCFVDSVVFKIGAENRRSRKAIERIGATYEGSARSKQPDGAVVSSVVYRIRPGELAWEKD